MFETFIFSMIPLFRMIIPFLIAMFKTIATTLGTASPRAHGHDATKTPIPLSTIQHMLQVGTVTYLKLRRKNQLTITDTLNRMTVLTKYFEIFLQATWILDCELDYSFYRSLMWVPTSSKRLLSNTFSTWRRVSGSNDLMLAPDSILAPWEMVAISSFPFIVLWTASTYPERTTQSTNSMPGFGLKISPSSINVTL